MSRFHPVGQFFYVDGTGPYVGLAVASNDAFYVASGLEPFSFQSLFRGRIGKPLAGESGPFQQKLADLPDSVTQDSSWPIQTTAGFVCVLPRDSISEIRCSWTGGVRIVSPEHSICVLTGPLRRFPILRSLRQLGWTV